jgi:hypothetical protein
VTTRYQPAASARSDADSKITLEFYVDLDDAIKKG